MRRVQTIDRDVGQGMEKDLSGAELRAADPVTSWTQCYLGRWMDKETGAGCGDAGAEGDGERVPSDLESWKFSVCV